MRIKSTVQPDERLSENEWMDRFKVSSQAKKWDGVDRARRVMDQWRDENNVRISYKEIIKQIKTSDILS